VDKNAKAFVERMARDLTKAKDNITVAQQRQCEQANKKRIDRTFKVGDKVFLSHKLTDRLAQVKDVAGTKAVFRNRKLGPFEIIQVIDDNAYKLRLPAMWKAHDVVNISYLTPAHDGSGKYPERDPPPPDPEVIDGEKHYSIEGLYSHRTLNGYLQYLAKYKGYSMEEAEWLFIDDLREDMDPATIRRLVSDYRHRRALEEDLQGKGKTSTHTHSQRAARPIDTVNDKSAVPAAPDTRQPRRSARLQNK
jgi:hypothetical protein